MHGFLAALSLAAASAALAEGGAAAAERTVALIGSSIAAGVGATVYDSAWAGRYSAQLASRKPAWKLISLAVPGYTTFHVLATGTKAVTGRPAVDTAHNLTKALSLHPTCLIISLTGNDISNGYAPSEYDANYDTLYAQAKRAGVEVWMTTPTPRTSVDSAKRTRIKELRTRMQARYPRLIDFYDSLANADATIQKRYDSGDGIHPNDIGHRLLFGRVAAADLPGSVTGLIAPRGLPGLPAASGSRGGEARNALGRAAGAGVTWK
jgi:lysophospholipase L1-like esterase